MEKIWKLVLIDFRKLQSMRWPMVLYGFLLLIFCIADLSMKTIYFAFYFILYFIVYIAAFYGGDYLVACLPVSRRQVVLARYLNCLLWICGLAVVILILRTIRGFGTFGDVIGVICLGMCFTAILIPFIFYFGPMKARFYVLGIYMIGIALFAAQGAITHNEIDINYRPGLGVLLVAIAVYLVSCIISLRIYEKRQFTD